MFFRQMASFLPTIIFACCLLFTIALALIDIKKKRICRHHPRLSVVIATYNDAEFIQETIKRLNIAYDNLDILVVNDASTDNTLELLKDVKVISNKINLGKVESVNKGILESLNEYILILDSDIIIRKENIDDMLSRINEENVGAVSCRFKIINKGMIPSMVNLEFSMLALTHSAYNVSTALSLWGGCILFKRKALLDIGLFKKNMITEDMDSALNLAEKGYKVQQCWTPVGTYSATKLSEWFEQKIRWAAGGMQCFLKHPEIFLFSPLSIIYFGAYTLMAYSFLASPFDLSNMATYGLLSCLLSTPYFFINLEHYKDIPKILLVVPFTVIYYPIWAVVSIIGLFVGAYKFYKLEEDDRGW